ncbi:hypothetical protein COCOBI_02-3740 [Coccomyxa sp. Obi]|nr:hypothetical protein COCOBI_02-3740 [Coccomyxa sp. Obi]
MGRGSLPKLARMYVPRMPTIIAARNRRPGGFLVPVHATSGGGGSGSCHGGPPPAKRTGDDDSKRPSSSKPLLANKTLVELAGPAAMLMGLCMISVSVYMVSVSIWNLGRGSVGCKPGLPLTTVLNRGIKTAQRGVLVAEHVTVKNGDAFSKMVLAVAISAGASNVTGHSTTTTIISGLTGFGMAIWASSSKRRKGV